MFVFIKNKFLFLLRRLVFTISIIGLLFINSGKLYGREKLDKKSSKRITLMGLGDSITEGGEDFHSYLYPLWERLFAGGYHIDFVGPRSSKCRIGEIHHCGFSGKNAEFLDSVIDSIYSEYPADIVLLHSGHNHSDTENPVDGIIEAQKSIINKILAINPGAEILVAKVIQSGKLPKYSYIPELNKRIKKMVNDLNLPNVILVDQSKKFNWKKHSINDKVHPNPKGAEVMADVWFKALKNVLPESEYTFHPDIVSYKTVDQGDLQLHIFKPEKFNRKEKYSVIIFFFAGGWSLGTPLQFYRECAYYSSKGLIAISADYRISYLNHTTPCESVEDAKDAIRWIRRNAEKWNINPDRIVVAGSSAGGHLAAATGTLKESENINFAFSYKPNLMVLYYPVIDISEEGYRIDTIKNCYQEISPLHNIDSTTPPALLILGTKDPVIPVKTAESFKSRMQENGVECELHLMEGAGHPIFYYAKDLTPEFYSIQKMTDNFLQKHGYLK